VAGSRTKPIDDLEKQVDRLLNEFRKKLKNNTGAEERLKEMEAELNRQAKELDRLRRKAAEASGELDLLYRRNREVIQSRLANVLARLEVL
jgi:ABC-type transporter Mla subunit MlaD